MAVVCAHQDQLIATQTQHTAILRLIQQHLGILSPPEHDMLGPLEPTDPSQDAPPAELWTLTPSTGPTRLVFKRKERNEKVGVFQF